MLWECLRVVVRLIVLVKSALATSSSFSLTSLSYLDKFSFAIFDLSSFNLLTWAEISNNCSFVGRSIRYRRARDSSECDDRERSKFPISSSSSYSGASFSSNAESWEEGSSSPSSSPLVSSFTISWIRGREPSALALYATVAYLMRAPCSA